MSHKSYLARYSRTDHTHVERTALVRTIEDRLQQDGIVFICAARGMGKSRLLKDIARNSRQKHPTRAVVFIDASSCEAESYLMGRSNLLEEYLTRQMRTRHYKHKIIRKQSESQKDSEAKETQTEQKSKHLTVPPVRMRYVSRMARLLWLYLSCMATMWATSFAQNMHSARTANCAPLLVVDNFLFPPKDDLQSFVETVRLWIAGGVQICIAGNLHSGLREYFTRALVVSGPQLKVPESEIDTWRRTLQISRDIDIYTYTHGIPLAVNVLRQIADTNSLTQNIRYKSAMQVCLSACLQEELSTKQSLVRTAMILLQKGSFQDLFMLNINVNTQDIQYLEREFLYLGINSVTGTFTCLPNTYENCREILVPLVRENADLCDRMVDYLILQDREIQAVQIVELMDTCNAIRSLYKNPATFIEMGCGGLIQQIFQAPVYAKGDLYSEEMLRLSVDVFTKFRDISHGVRRDSWTPLTLEPKEAQDQHFHQQISCCNNIYNAILETTLAWNNLWGSGYGALSGQSETFFVRDDKRRLCVSMARSSLDGDTMRFCGLLEELMSSVELYDIRLDDAIFIHYAFRCSMLCDSVTFVNGHLVTLDAMLRSQRVHPHIPANCTDALLSSDLALAGLISESPDARKPLQLYMNELRECLAFYENRKITLGIAAVKFNVCFALMTSGRELEARTHLDYLINHWNTQQNPVGQALGAIATCWSTLVLGGITQARVYVQTAKNQINRIGARGLIPYSRLFETIAVVRSRNPLDIDKRLLDTELQRNSLYPHSPVTLDIELALLYIACDERENAEAILIPLTMHANSKICRLLYCTSRCLGSLASGLIETIPEPVRSIAALGAHTRFSNYVEPAKFLATSAANPRDPLITPDISAKPFLRITLFGSFTVEKSGNTIPNGEWNRSMARNLLVLLAIHCGSNLTRSDLMSALWADKSQYANRNSLNTALSSLRHTLGQIDGGPEFIVCIGNTIGLNQAIVTTDVVEFEQLAHDVLTNNTIMDTNTILNMCARIEELYKTGLFVCTDSLLQAITPRSNELQELFLESMVLASNKAAEAKLGTTALYFARAAKKIPVERADADAALFTALSLIHNSFDQTVSNYNNEMQAFEKSPLFRVSEQTSSPD